MSSTTDPPILLPTCLFPQSLRTLTRTSTCSHSLLLNTIHLRCSTLHIAPAHLSQHLFCSLCSRGLHSINVPVRRMQSDRRIPPHSRSQLLGFPTLHLCHLYHPTRSDCLIHSFERHQHQSHSLTHSLTLTFSLAHIHAHTHHTNACVTHCLSSPHSISDQTQKLTIVV